MNCLFVFFSVSFCILHLFTIRTSATISTNNRIPRAIKGLDECVLHRPSHALPHLLCPLKLKTFSPKISTTIIFTIFYCFTMHAKQTRWLGVRERKSKSYPNQPHVLFQFSNMTQCLNAAVIQTEWPNRSKSPDT